MFNKCDICKKKFTSFATMRKHREGCSKKLSTPTNQTTNNLSSLEISKIIQNAKRVCKYCKAVVEENDYNDHLQTQHSTLIGEGKKQEKPAFQCVICSKKFSRIFTLKDHVNSVHKSLTPVIKCPLCPRSHFLSEDELNRHTEQTHASVRRTRGSGGFREISSALNRVIVVYAHSFQPDEVQSIEELEQRDDVWSDAKKILHREVSDFAIVIVFLPI